MRVILGGLEIISSGGRYFLRMGIVFRGLASRPVVFFGVIGDGICRLPRACLCVLLGLKFGRCFLKDFCVV